MFSLVELVSGIEKGLGRNASYVEASTTERTSLLNANCLEPLLASLDGGNVTTRATSDDCQVVFLGCKVHA
jgi:hypothetical protein